MFTILWTHRRRVRASAFNSNFSRQFVQGYQGGDIKQHYGPSVCPSACLFHTLTNKYQLSLMNPCDTLHHGRRAADKGGRSRFQVIASYLSKVANLNLPYVHLAPPLGVTQFDPESLGHRVALLA